MTTLAHQRPACPSEGEGAASRSDLLDAAVAGLSAHPKTLPCKYFYDDAGCALFDRICELPEYYPTRTELSIMRRHAGEMAALLGSRCALLELGSGSSVKTRVLLDGLDDPAAYVPIDIAGDPLRRTAAGLRNAYPRLDVLPLCADYTGDFDLPALPGDARPTWYFPGSTIGNLHPPEAERFLARLGAMAGPEASLLIGVDLRKPAEVLVPAYDDAQGVTAAFNRNLLHRLNRELGAGFDPAAFEHRAVWNDAASRVEMHLVSARRQAVRLGGVGFSFEAGEAVQTESSYKYTLDRFAAVASGGGWAVGRVWMDAGRLFSVQYLTPTAPARDRQASRRLALH